MSTRCLQLLVFMPSGIYVAPKSQITSLGSCRSQTVATAMVDNRPTRENNLLGNKNKSATQTELDLDIDRTCHKCKIDLSGRTTASAAQHRRRCNAPPIQPDGYICEICKSKFRTFAGLRQHQRRTHIQEYNSNDLNLRNERLEKSRAKYTESEIKTIAYNEAAIKNRAKLLVKDILKILSEKSNRPIEGIRKIRLKENYKKYLNEALDKSKAPDIRAICPNSPQIVLTRCDDTYLHNDTNNSQETTVNSYNINNPIVTSDMRNLLNEIKDDMGVDMQKIINSILSNSPSKNIMALLDNYINNLPTYAITADPTQSNNSNRNSLNAQEAPEMDKLEKYYTELFAQKDIGWKPQKYQTNNNNLIDLSYPISPTEIHEQLKKLKQSAPGIDGVDRQILRETPRQELRALLNIIWGMKTLPPTLRLNRTTLLPKTGDLKNPKQWRPITISSSILRLLNKIILTRLEDHVQLFHTQRGFTRTDVLDNLLIQLNECDGVNVGDAEIRALAFADDIVLAAPTPKVMQNNIQVVERFFRKHGLEVNPEKCAAFQNVRVPGTKRLAVDTQSKLIINKNPIPTLGVASQLKYLGYIYSFRGTITPSPSKLE
ncbi:uncharacterized protein LOC144477510, partial [Augochlora pura]